MRSLIETSEDSVKSYCIIHHARLSWFSSTTQVNDTPPTHGYHPAFSNHVMHQHIRIRDPACLLKMLLFWRCPSRGQTNLVWKIVEKDHFRCFGQGGSIKQLRCEDRVTRIVRRALPQESVEVLPFFSVLQKNSKIPEAPEYGTETCKSTNKLIIL